MSGIDSVLLVAFGGPTAPAEIRPFLEIVARGRRIPPQRLEEVALHDDYFVERKLYPNVDFYSGLIYRAIGFPKNMFTNCFAIGRLPGWIAQWKEMIESPETKIGRPRQVYVGPAERDYVPIERR